MHHRRLLAAAIVALWAGGIALGAHIFWRYEGTASPAGHAPGQFPQSPGLRLARRRDTLLLFLHPHCPCSRATLHELRKILRAAPRAFAVHLVFVRPPHAPRGWCHTTLLARANNIPGVRVQIDRHARLARAFNAKTSGQVDIYGPPGTLLYSGGITGSRGHRGYNAGFAAVLALGNGNKHVQRRAPVFGCALLPNPFQKGFPVCKR